MKRFQLLDSDHPTRRAFFFMPFAFAGLVAVSSSRERKLPDASENGSGSEVSLVIFSNDGKREGIVRVKKLTKTKFEWRKVLSSKEFEVTREKGTEIAFTGSYWKHHEPGLYRCVCCGNALFGSREKYDSGTGWPSYWAPLADENIRTEKDMTLFMERVEVLCAKCDAHLGHVFNDGPPPTGLRYCINSAALRFTEQTKAI